MEIFAQNLQMTNPLGIVSHRSNMPNKPRKNSLKSAKFWSRFEKSGSIQAYLRFREAVQVESAGSSLVKAAARTSSGKRNAGKSKTPAR